MISINYNVFHFRVPFYCIGDREAIKEAIRNLFTKGGFVLHDEKENTFYHYPSGWGDRLSTGYVRFSNINKGPYSDSLAVTWYLTNHPFITLVSLDFYFKKNKSRADEKFQAFLRSVMDGIDTQMSMFDLTLIAPEGWLRITKEHPEFSCSPVWDTVTTRDPRGFAELRASS